ncbi:MAG: asparagine--tRNA ligase [Firmicutes bacterium]|nr:asparagine--tRNA ligase [Bacillota bacterium]
MKHIDIKEIVENKKKFIGKSVTVCGWVRTSRDSKTVAFVELNDGTMLKHMQIVFDKEKIDNCAAALPLCTSLKITGKVVKAANNPENVEINADTVEVLGECPPEYPIQKKPHSLEFLRTIPHLRMRTNTFSAMFRIRNVLTEAIHKYYLDRNYVYAHTPIITGSDCEGAGEGFKVTTIGYSNKFKTEEEYHANDFFSKSAGLTVSGQLEGEMMAMAFGKIYTFGPTFRAENSNTSRHAAEFWMNEPEVAFCDIDGLIEIAEEFIKFITKFVLDKCKDELAFFERFYEKGLIEKLTGIVEKDFARVDYTEAIEILKKCSKAKEFQYPVEWGCDLQTEHERYLTEEHFAKPCFVVNYPKAIKSFYMKQNDDGKTVAATDLLVPGVGEIIGGSEREANYEKLKNEIVARGMNLSDYEQYLDLRKYGSVPHAGFGLGLERMLMYITGIGNIRDTAIFPRARNELR